MFQYIYNMEPYEDEIKDFSWEISENELGYKKGDIINIGEICRRPFYHLS